MSGVYGREVTRRMKGRERDGLYDVEIVKMAGLELLCVTFLLGLCD